MGGYNFKKITMKQIALITDTHIGEDNYEEVASVFEQLFEQCLELEINTIYHLGDVFHSRKGQSDTVLNAWGHILNLMEQRYDLKMICIVGNHDKLNQENDSSFLTPFSQHKNFILIEQNDSVLVEDTMMNFISYFPNEKQQRLVDCCKNHEGIKSVLLTHADVKGFKMNGAAVSEHGFDQGALSQFDLVLVGHYHDISEIGNIKYIGAGLQHNFGEHPIKGFTILDVDTLETQLVPLKSKRYLTIKADPNDLRNIQKLDEGSKDSYRVEVVLDESEVAGKSSDLKALKEMGYSIKVKKEVSVSDVLASNQEANQINEKGLLDLLKEFCEEKSYKFETLKQYFNV
jgi:DNA repair exonuclease SbcCD nuclease subunit